MLNIDTNSKNKKVFNPNPKDNGSSYGIWDLTSSSIDTSNNTIQFESVHVVSDGEEMRTDLLAARKYSDQGKVGTLLKLNAYSNPFAIDVGDTIYVPTSDSIEKAYNARRKKITTSTDQQNVNPNKAFINNQKSKKFSPSNAREKYINNNKNRTGNLNNPTNGLLPPNILNTEEKAIVTKSGLIFFGPDATSPNS